MNNIFVGNLSFEATKEDVVKLFEEFGAVANVLIMQGKKGKSRGYGFVDMPNEEEKNAAITALQGKEFMWRVLSVSSVIPKVKGEVKVKKFKPAKKEWNKSKDRPVVEKTSESKYYSKFDGPPKPWRKVNSDSKPSSKKNTGSRPYYGKKGQSQSKARTEERSKFSNLPNKSTKGFKMFHKVSGASKTGPKKGQAEGL